MLTLYAYIGRDLFAEHDLMIDDTSENNKLNKYRAVL